MKSLLTVALCLYSVIQHLQTSHFYVSLLFPTTPSSRPVCGPVFHGKGVRFTTSEDVYPEKGMWHQALEPETSRSTRKSPDQSPAPSTLHPQPSICILTPHPPPTPACSDSSQLTDSMHKINTHVLTLNTCQPLRWELYAFMHETYTLMSVCTLCTQNTYTMTSMYEQTLKHDVWTSVEYNENALKCAGILMQHDVIKKGPRTQESSRECVSVQEFDCLCLPLRLWK